MKKLVLFPLAILLVAALLFAGCAGSTPAPTSAPATTSAPAPTATPASAAVINLKYSSAFLPPEPPELMGNFFCNYIEKESRGRVKIERFNSAALGGPMEQLDLVKSGSCDITTLIVNMFPADLPISCIMAELLLSRQEAVAKANTFYFENPETVPLFEKEWKRHNIKMMNYNCAGELGIIANFPAKSMADLKGKKVGALLDQPFFKDFGMEFVNIQIPEVYEGLSRGVIDAMEMGITPMEVLKWYEVSKVYLRYNIILANDPQIVNLNTWNKLPPDIQKIFKDAAKATVDFGLKLDEEMTNKTLQTFKDSGLAIIALTNDDQTKVFNARFDGSTAGYLDFAGRAGVSEDAQVILKNWKNVAYPK